MVEGILINNVVRKKVANTVNETKKGTIPALFFCILNLVYPNLKLYLPAAAWVTADTIA